MYENSAHNHFIKLPVNDEDYFFISVLLWNASSFNTAEERIAFVASPFLMSGESLRKMDVGIETIISNAKTTFTSYREEVSPAK